MSTNSRMATPIFFEQTSTFHKTSNILPPDIVSLLLDASSAMRHPACFIADCKFHFNAQKNQVMECINCQLNIFRSNLITCQWVIGTLLFWTLILFNDSTKAEHCTDCLPRQRLSNNDPFLPVAQCDLPLLGGPTTFSKRRFKLHARIQRLWSPISTLSRLDLPQRESEDNDEAWLTEFIGCEAVSKAAETYLQLEEYLKAISPSHPTPKTQSVSEPNLPRTTDSANSTNAKVCDLPGPMFREYEEDSLPFTPNLDMAKHIPF